MKFHPILLLIAAIYVPSVLLPMFFLPYVTGCNYVQVICGHWIACNSVHACEPSTSKVHVASWTLGNSRITPLTWKPLTLSQNCSYHNIRFKEWFLVCEVMRIFHQRFKWLSGSFDLSAYEPCACFHILFQYCDLFKAK